MYHLENSMIYILVESVEEAVATLFLENQALIQELFPESDLAPLADDTIVLDEQ